MSTTTRRFWRRSHGPSKWKITQSNSTATALRPHKPAGLPQYRLTRPALLQIGRGGVLLDNAETHANIGLIARHGAAWFRSVGTSTRPGTTVTSVAGNGKAIVLEVPYGTPIRCDRFSHCAELAPPLVTLDEWGYPILPEEPFAQSDRELHRSAQLAVRRCPRQALTLQRISAAQS